MNLFDTTQCCQSAEAKKTLAKVSRNAETKSKYKHDIITAKQLVNNRH